MGRGKRLDDRETRTKGEKKESRTTSSGKKSSAYVTVKEQSDAPVLPEPPQTMLSRCPAFTRHVIGFLVLVLLTANVRSGPRYSSRIVDIQTGAIRGIILELNSRHLEPVEVFRGVPYAAPPVGPLRFRLPQPPLPWPGTRLADTFGAVCPQKLPDVSNKTAALLYMPKGRYQYLKKLVPLLVNQSEDCLFLNIYVPGSGK
ncbi:hypothetical protein GEV33_002738 [Tenebrio molitor]|uniref:Carboxylesterase type B domain-containing protein n=1 Tax=Tenebrio molitor TaxID=7067 RepID=A0A8J6HUY8_TENMO|nr:hypothetical protein GEV33_002738 [Tenebrio molitor]